MRQALADIGADLGHAVDPRLWTKEYPWASLGVAVVASFAATSAVVPSKRQAAMKRLERIEKMLAAEDLAREEARSASARTHEQKPNFASQFIKQLIGLVQPAVVSAVAAGVRGKMEQ